MRKAGSDGVRKRAHEPLGEQGSAVAADSAASRPTKRKAGGRAALGSKTRHTGDDDGADWDESDAEEHAFMPSKTSRRILDEAREQQEEEAAGVPFSRAAASKRRVQFSSNVEAGSDSRPSLRGGGGSSSSRGRSNFSRGEEEDEEEGDDNERAEDEDDEIIEFAADDDVHLEGDFVNINDEYGGKAEAEDAAILARFMSDAPAERRTLADIIMEKLAEVQEQQDGDAAAASGLGAGGRPPMDPKIVEVYTDVGKYLSHYKSGKLPKVFKVIPALGNWEEVLFLTNPETWTPHATNAATRIFASNFNPAKAQRFFNLVLLPKCRDDIAFHKRLNFHLYLALRKATYKPAAFYKGILLPLAASGDCGLKEAIIFGSVLSKTSVPLLHSAAALIKLSGMTYNASISIFLRLMVNKKYTLPYMAIDAVVEHFTSFRNVAGPLPVIWHQSLLTVAQRYKAEITREQKEALKALMGVHAHHLITAEIRRELFTSGSRGDPIAALPGQAPSSSSSAAASTAKPHPRAAGAVAIGPRQLVESVPQSSAAAGAGRPKSKKGVATGDSMDDY